MQAQCLTLEVRDIDRPQGFLYVAFYSSPDNFLKKPLTGPQEPTAFSNDAQGVMGPPSFEECSFTLRSDTTLVVHLRR